MIPHPALTSSTSSLIGDVCISSGNGDMLVHRASFAAKEDITTRRFIYDHADRLTETWHKINSQPDTRIGSTSIMRSANWLIKSCTAVPTVQQMPGNPSTTGITFADGRPK